jgi:hypothetical protein
MSGSTSQAHVSQLVPRSNSSGVYVLAYDPIADSFASLYPSALQGLQGPQGAQGATGPQGPQGLPGSPGANGSTVLNGFGAPSSALGANNDWYIDRQNWLIYGPKTNGAWGSGVSLIGPQGPQGVQGPTGPAGSGGTGTGTANLDNGTVDGQIAVWSATSSKWVAQTGVSIVADRSPTVELNANTTLTFAAHNRRNIVLSALASLTLAAAEIGTSPTQGMEFTINNDHTATNQITFGSGITVSQPSTGTGAGGVVKIAASGLVAVQIYPRGTSLIAKCRGDVA